MRWLVQILLVLSVVVQGDCLRACQLHRMIACDQGALTSVESTGFFATVACLDDNIDPGSRPSEDNSAPCPCEFRKGLAQPDRGGAEVPVFAFVSLFWSPSQFDSSSLPSIPLDPSQLPAVTLISHSPPLLI
jgi:hypothetical protein